MLDNSSLRPRAYSMSLEGRLSHFSTDILLPKFSEIERDIELTYGGYTQHEAYLTPTHNFDGTLNGTD